MQIDSEYIEEWFTIAERDLNRSKLLIENQDWEGAGSNIQQSIEKCLKGFLIERGWKLSYTHDLELLIKEAIYYEKSFDEFLEACQIISTYYMWDRYPKMMEEPLDKDDVRKAMMWAEKIRDKVKQERSI